MLDPLLYPLPILVGLKSFYFLTYPQTHTALVYLSRTLLQPPLFSTPLTHYAFTQDADVLKNKTDYRRVYLL